MHACNAAPAQPSELGGGGGGTVGLGDGALSVSPSLPLTPKFSAPPPPGSRGPTGVAGPRPAEEQPRMRRKPWRTGRQRGQQGQAGAGGRAQQILFQAAVRRGKSIEV